MLARMSDSASRKCPDCGVANALNASICTECNHPMDPLAEKTTVSRPIRRRPRPRSGPQLPGMTKVVEEEGKVIPRRTHSRIGFLGIGGGDRPRGDDAPNWIWLILGTFALGAALFAAIGNATREPPFSVPGASPVQANIADSLRRALRKDSLNVDGYIRLANLLYDTQNYEQAVPYYRTVLRLDPGKTDARVDLGVALHQSGHTGEAVSELGQVLAEHPDHAIAWFDLGVIYEFIGDLNGAEEAYLTAAELDVKPELAHAIDQRLREIRSKKEVNQ